jgi:Trehalase
MSSPPEATSLLQLLSQVLIGFALPRAPTNEFVFGFVTPTESASITICQSHVQLEPDIKNAEYIIFGTQAQFAELFDNTSSQRAAVAAQLEMRPAYPFSAYLLSIFLAAFALDIPDLDTSSKPLQGTFPFPMRYPVGQNPFRRVTPRHAPAKTEPLPRLIAPQHPAWEQMFDYACHKAIANLRQPKSNSGFVAPFMDAAFNDNSFLWDGCFMSLFGRYLRRSFDPLGTLENFYAKQHDDGFICREINTHTGRDVFQSLDPRSTGPNILAWCELEHFAQHQNSARLEQVFAGLIAYHRWWRDWRTHPNGAYWTSGWGSGMDNQSRIPKSEYHHRHAVWLDANAQMALSAKCLLEMACIIGRDEFNHELWSEYQFLVEYINQHLWDEAQGFYFDALPDGSLSPVKSIGAFWTLLAGVVPPERLPRFLAHLENPDTFCRPHRIPTQSADSLHYNPDGGYWLGAVWSPTNYMVLRGLAQLGQLDLAFAIAQNHIENVAQVFLETGTLFENYAPELTKRGNPSSPNFVGWTGLSAIAIPLEFMFGLYNHGDTLHWNPCLLEPHGVEHYPIGNIGIATLLCAERHNSQAPLRLEIDSNCEFKLLLRGTAHQIAKGKQVIVQ